MNRTRWLLLLALVAVSALAVILYWRAEPSSPDSHADEVAAAFLEALDRGELETLQTLSTLPELQLKYLNLNRETLGARHARRVLKRELLRQGAKFGAYLEYESNYENAPRIRESLTVLGDQVVAARFFYPQLPRLTPRTYAALPEEARAKVQLATRAYDQLSRNFFDGITARDTGWIQRGVFQRIRNFHQRFGVPKTRSLGTETRQEKSLPGAAAMSVLRVVNKTLYENDKGSWRGEEVVYLVRDGSARKPQWEVYGFELKSPERVP